MASENLKGKIQSGEDREKGKSKKIAAGVVIFLGLSVLSGCVGGSKEVTLPDGTKLQVSQEKTDGGKEIQVIKDENGEIITKILGDSVGNCDGKKGICVKQKTEECSDKTLDIEIGKYGKVGEPFCKIESFDVKYKTPVYIAETLKGFSLRTEDGRKHTETYEKIEEINGVVVATIKKENGEEKKVILGNHRVDDFFGEVYVYQHFHNKGISIVLDGKEKDKKRVREYDEVKALGNKYVVAYYNSTDEFDKKVQKSADLLGVVKADLGDREKTKYSKTVAYVLGDNSINNAIKLSSASQRITLEDFKFKKVGDTAFLVGVYGDGEMVIFKQFPDDHIYKTGDIPLKKGDEFFKDIIEKDGMIMGITISGEEFPLKKNGDLKYNGSLSMEKNNFGEDVKIISEDLGIYPKKNYLLVGEEQIFIKKIGPLIFKSKYDPTVLDREGKGTDLHFGSIPHEYKGNDGITYLVRDDVYYGYYTDGGKVHLIEENIEKPGKSWSDERYKVVGGKLYFLKLGSSGRERAYFQVDKKTGKTFGDPIDVKKMQKRIDKEREEAKKAETNK